MSKKPKRKDEPPKLPFQERPRICLIDVDDEIGECLKSTGFNCFLGTLGSSIEVPNQRQHDKHQCLLNYNFPPNLHEYDIVVVDLQNQKKIPYRPEHHLRTYARGPRQFTFISYFPETLFDPRPMASWILHTDLEALRARESIFIVFAAENESVEYFLGNITASGLEPSGTERKDTYDFFPQLPAFKNTIGTDITVVVPENNELGRLLRSHNNEAIYRIVFEHAEEWKGGRWVKDPGFAPLMVTPLGGIVSFTYFPNQNAAFFFPHIKRKERFLVDLFQTVLPEIFPGLFPYSTQFRWLNNQSYRLPNEEALLNEKSLVQKESEQKLKEIDQKILANHDRYRYLHDLLTQSGNELVKTVENYLKWLEFKNVVNVDEANPEIREEDLQVELRKGLLVVEVKGIGGTSTDSECSQISKIKYRRAKERGSFDVYALYLVNHQRFLPPEKRTNPPFSTNQIQDAQSDERGLLTTYDLFKLHFNIENGFVTKKDARDTLFQTGLVRFAPSNAVEMSPPYEIHYNGYVVVLQIKDTRITNRTEVILDEHGFYRRTVIVEIQIDGKTVDSAESGEVGIAFADQITTKTRIWLKA